MSCMICRKSDVRLFSVGKNYGTINHTVGDDLVEIYGDKVSMHLSPDSVVCNVCMNILDNMAMLIRNIWSIITNPCEQPQPGLVVKLWKFFASVKIEEDMKDELQNSRNKALTPSKLLKHVYSVPYQSNEEDHIAEQERMRSLSRVSSISNTSELTKIFSGSGERKTRRKKKGHNWSRSKRGRPKSVDYYSSVSQTKSAYSASVSRPTSDCSSRSTRSNRRSPARKKQIVQYDDQGRLIQKRTRSVSRAQEEEENMREQIEGSKFYCMEKDCTLYFKDLDVLNLHKIMDHGVLALYYCEECQQRYTTLQHFKLHLKVHDISSFFCLVCGCELANRSELQSHLDQHLVYSVPCKYCDRAFLSKLLREYHIKAAHRGRRKRQIHRDELKIDRFDSGSSEKENNVKYKKDYSVKYIYHTDMEYESEDLDVTVDNLKLKNIEFHQFDDDDDRPADNSELRLEDMEDRLGEDSVLGQDNNSELRHPDDSELRHSDGSELRHSDGSELRHPDDSELRHSDGSELRHSDDSELRHSRDSELKHSGDSELRHSDDSELRHSRDSELRHSGDSELRHPDDLELTHPDDSELRPSDDSELITNYSPTPS